MKLQLKQIKDQVIVITGASSGIGLSTARMAASKGARVFAIARSKDALQQLQQEYPQQIRYCTADVGKKEELQRAANQVLQEFGGFDTWVNDAGVSIYGLTEKTPVEDMKKLFDTNFWGVVHGSLIALQHLRTKGGVLINIGSVVSDRAIPLQGIYCASKHAIKGFTDSLRMEIETEKLPVSVTLIKPGAIDTPYPDHAKNYMAEEPTLPPPLYAPEVVAQNILYAAEHQVRDIVVGGGGKLIASGNVIPRVSDKVMNMTMFSAQKGERRNGNPVRDSLYSPSNDLRERSGKHTMVAKSSMYTKASLHPIITGAVLGLGALLLSRGREIRP